MITRAVLSIAVLCAAVFAQKQSVETRRDRVYIDFTVTGAAGQFIPGLTVADFELFQDARRLKVATAKLVQKPERTLVLVVDDLGLSLDGFQRVKRALRKFVTEELRSGDHIAIVHTGGHHGAMQQFTADSALLSAALERLDFNLLNDPAGNQPASFGSGTMLQLGFVMKGLKQLPGRKAVVLFSERFGVPRADSGTQVNIESAASRLSDSAGQAMAVLYVIHSGLPVPTPAPVQIETGLAATVKDTGGLWVDGAADVFASLQRVLEDQEQHYLVEFVPDASYDFRFEKIAVKIARPALQARARRVVYRKSDDDLETFAIFSNDEKATLSSPFDGGDFALRATPVFFHSAADGLYLDIILHMDAKRLTFTRNLTGQYKCALEVSSAAFDASGQTAGEASRAASYGMMEDGYRRTLEGGIVYTQRLPLRKPGAYQLRVAVVDEATGRVGSSGLYIEVPDVKNSAFAMSGVIVRTGRTTPVDAASEMRESSAVRIFRPGGSFAYGYQFYNLAANESKRSRAELQARLFLEGAEVFIGRPTTIEFDRNTSNATVVNGTISLNQDMKPGRYTLQIIATDKFADKPQTISQSIDLEVRP